MKAGAVVLAVIAAPLVLVLALVLVFSSTSSPASACGPLTAVSVAAETIPDDATVGGYEREQLANAAAILNAAAALGLPATAQTLGVQTAIGESSLVNLDRGDGATNPDGSTADSIGLFQQQSSWGTAAQRIDPTTAATLFFQRLVAVEGWEDLDPSIAINKVQINADPFHYVTYRADAVAITGYLTKLGGGESGGCSVSGDAKTVATDLVVAIDNGSLTLLDPRYADQIRNMANGSAADGCLIDLRVLQIISLALQKFNSVGVSDLNRHCTGSLEGAGTGSSHYFKGGGYAVDIYALNGASLGTDGADNLALLDLLSSVAPDGTRAGQVNCRSGETWAHITQFEDTCNHQHIDFGYTDLPLNVTN